MDTWFSLLLVSVACLPSFSSSNSFSSPSLFSLPVPFNPSSSSPVVVIPIIEEAQLNRIPPESPLQPPFPFLCPSAGYHRDPLSCQHFFICTDLWAVGAPFQVRTQSPDNFLTIKTGVSTCLCTWDSLGRGSAHL